MLDVVLESVRDREEQDEECPGFIGVGSHYGRDGGGWEEERTGGDGGER